MRIENNLVTVEMYPDAGNGMLIGSSSIQGTRKYQEDAIFSKAYQHKTLAVLCDGMGGLDDGALASNTAVDSIREGFEQEEIEEVPLFFRQQAKIADEKVSMLTAEDGTQLSCGSTVVAVIIRKNKLHWLSVGDSRIYIVRNQEILAVNEEHNYKAELNKLLMEGRITREYYESELYRGEALTSYIGMGNVRLIDVNEFPFDLIPGDYIILCSDGMYRTLAEEEIYKIVTEHGDDVQKAAIKLTDQVMGKGRKNQDNTSVIVLRYPQKNQEENLNEVNKM